MSARTGQKDITGLKARPRAVWIDGPRVEDMVIHPALHSGVQFVAALSDICHEPELRGDMTYTSPSTGDLVDLTFIIPGGNDDLELRRTVMPPNSAPLQAGHPLFGRPAYPRMVEFIQLVGANSLMDLPTGAGFDTENTPGINQYMATATTPEKTKLFHIEWDMSYSSFSSGQVLCQRMFCGNPSRNAIPLFEPYDKQPFKRKVRNFLNFNDAQVK